MMVCIQLSAGPSNVVIYLCSSVSAPWCNRNTRSSQSIGSMSQGGICVLVGNHYDTMVLYYIIQECDSLGAFEYKVFKSFM